MKALRIGAIGIIVVGSVTAAARQLSALVPHETVATIADVALPNIPGNRLVSRVIDYPPGSASAPHRHAASAFIYAHVLSGRIESRVDDQPARVYLGGETWLESPGAHHQVSRNASNTEPARLLA